MELPAGIPTVAIAGLFAFYIGMLSYVFRLSRDIEVDFQQVTLPNLKTREVNTIREFFETERSNKTSQTEQKPDSRGYQRIQQELQEKIRRIMEKSWANAYECYKIEDLLGRLIAREDKGRIFCIVSIILLIGSIILYMFPGKDISFYQILGILFLWFFPLIAIAILAIGNVMIGRNIRTAKKEIEKTWQF